MLAVIGWVAVAVFSLIVGYPPDYYASTALSTTGVATYYAPGVTEQVLAYRTRIGQLAPCQECVGYVAMLRAGDIGRKVWLEYQDTTIGPLLVIDCATPWDYLRLRNWWAVDVSWQIAQTLHMRGPITVTIYDHDPRPPPPPPLPIPPPEIRSRPHAHIRKPHLETDSPCETD